MSKFATFISFALTAAGTGGIPLGGFAFAVQATKIASAIGTLSTISSGLSIFSSLTQGRQQAGQLQQRAETSQFNAEVARQDAVAARQAAQVEAGELREDTRRRISAQRAKLAAGGILSTEGSALLIQQEEAEEGELAAQRRLFSGETQARGATQRAQLATREGQFLTRRAIQTETASRIGAGTQLLTGASNLFR